MFDRQGTFSGRRSVGRWTVDVDEVFSFRSVITVSSSLTHLLITAWQQNNYFILAWCGHPVPMRVLCTTLVPFSFSFSNPQLALHFIL